MSLELMQFITEQCDRCTQVAPCVEISHDYFLCGECFAFRLMDIDGRTSFVKVCQKMGILEI